MRRAEVINTHTPPIFHKKSETVALTSASSPVVIVHFTNHRPPPVVIHGVFLAVFVAPHCPSCNIAGHYGTFGNLIEPHHTCGNSRELSGTFGDFRELQGTLGNFQEL